MRKHRALMALSLVLASTCTLAAAAFAEDMYVDTDKTYTAGTNNGQAGFWIEYTRKHFARNANYIASPVGRYDATIQEVLAGAGLNRALSPAELTNIYNRYGIPFASSASYDGAAYHNFDWNSALAQIRADVAAGRLSAPSAPASDLALVNKLLNANSSSALIDSLGSSTLDSYIREAYAQNQAAAAGQWMGADNFHGGAYTYWGDTGNGRFDAPGWHTLANAHGINYLNNAQIDQATFNRDANRSIQDLLFNAPQDLKQCTGAGNVDSILTAARFTAIADQIDKGINPVGLKIDQWVNTTNGPVHIIESQPSAARLRDLAHWLIASEWTTHSPIALDLNHDGKIGVTGSSTAQKRLHEHGFVAQGAVWFDIMANGKKQHVEWLNNDGDGFLVDDTNGRVSKAAAKNGEIDAHALFGDAIGYANGYHKLAVLAAKKQVASTLRMSDAVSWNLLWHQKPVLKGKELTSLKVWVNKKHDGLVHPDELYSLASLGITEIGTRPEIKKNASGEYVIQSYFIQHGKRYLTEDVWFAEDPATQKK